VHASLKLPRRASYADYLVAEQSAAFRHEFFDGVIVAMAGGSDEHIAIAGRVIGAFMNRTSGPCRPYTADQRFWIAAQRRARYSDASIICGSPEHPAHDNQATTNPTVVVEVLSPSSEGDDDGEKRRDFQSLHSLRAYLLVHQDERTVRIYRRGSGGDWKHAAEVFRDGDHFELPAVSGPIAVAEIYDGVLDAEGRSLLRS